LHVVVEFFGAGGPVFERACNGVLGIGEADGERFLRAVAAGLNSYIIEP